MTQKTTRGSIAQRYVYQELTRHQHSYPLSESVHVHDRFQFDHDMIVLSFITLSAWQLRRRQVCTVERWKFYFHPHKPNKNDITHLFYFHDRFQFDHDMIVLSFITLSAWQLRRRQVCTVERWKFYFHPHKPNKNDITHLFYFPSDFFSHGLLIFKYLS